MRTIYSVAVNVVVVILVVGVLAAMLLPSGGSQLVKGSHTQTLSNMKQLCMATVQMAQDGRVASDTNPGWPGETGGTFTNWASQLTIGGYLSTNDICKLLSAPGVVVWPDRIWPENRTALLVYAVKEDAADQTVFLTSANFTNTPSGGVSPLEDAKPYGKKGFVVFRKGGDGAILLQKQAGQTNIIGAYAPLCR